MTTLPSRQKRHRNCDGSQLSGVLPAAFPDPDYRSRGCGLAWIPMVRFPVLVSFGLDYRFDDEYGAGDESRTRDLNLGKVALYQLSYSRVRQPRIISETGGRSK